MLHIYLYKKSGEELPNHEWQHRTGQLLLAWAKAQPENQGLCYENISHSGTAVTVAVADRPVGVDVECRRTFTERLPGRVLTEGERLYMEQAADRDMTFLQLWTLKESYGKSYGVGIAYPLQKTEFFAEERLGSWQRFSCTDRNVCCLSMAGEKQVLSVCIHSLEQEEPVFILVKNTSLM